MTEENGKQDGKEQEEVSGGEAPEGRAYEKYKRQPMSDASGWTLLSASAVAAGIIALSTLVLEVATDQWLARVLGFGFYVTTPLGVGATFLTVLVGKNDLKRAAIPGLLVLLYWLVYLFGA